MLLVRLMSMVMKFMYSCCACASAKKSLPEAVASSGSPRDHLQQQQQRM
jgi:hypothetical protein